MHLRAGVSLNIHSFVHSFGYHCCYVTSAPRLVQQRPWYVLSSLWDGAYKRTLAANRKEYPMWQQQVSSLTI